VWPPLSALLEAAKAGHSSTALRLLECGADPEVGPNPRVLAVRGIVHAGPSAQVQDEKGNTALWILLEKNMTDAALAMVQRHHASVAQCSRERSKVQRAKLLLKHAQRRVGKSGAAAGALGDIDSEFGAATDEAVSEPVQSAIEADLAAMDLVRSIEEVHANVDRVRGSSRAAAGSKGQSEQIV
jgi:hypothetical protein